MHKLVILGIGRIGSSIAKLLQHCGHYQLTLVDKFQKTIDELDGTLKENTICMCMDITDEKQLLEILKNNDAVISACSFTENLIIATQALAAGCSYFDLTEDVACTQQIIELSKQAKKGQVFMPQCGLAPGFIGILGYDMSKRFDTLFNLKMRVGALPEFPSNQMLYNLTWSTDGLINEYCNPCEAIKDYQYTTLVPLEGLESFSLDGVEYEAFNTSGGLGTLSQTLAGQVQELTYKTIRYPGHRYLMDFLLNGLRLGKQGKRRDMLKQIFESSIAVTSQDVVLVMASATGLINDQLTELTDVYKIYHQQLNGLSAMENWSAIQITTASAVCVAVDLFFAGQLAHSGLIKQEDLSLTRFLSNQFASPYKQNKRGIKYAQKYTI
jgi:saccharopine dehydrogenase-like NADP-dependent oxidoreductase